MKRRPNLFSLVFAFILLSTTLVCVQGQQRQTEQIAKPEEAKVVVVFQLKRKGEFAGGLQKQDFSVYEDDAKQEMTQFNEVDTPLSIVLLLDLSNSMKKSIRYVRENAEQIGRGFGADDEVALITFATDVILAQRFTKDKQQLATRLGQVPVPAGYTTLNDGLKEAGVYLARSAKPGNRRVIMVFTDDQDTASSVESLKQASHAIFNSGIVVCGLIVSAASRVLAAPSEGAVARLIRQTGGISISVDEQKLSKQIAEAVRSLHRHYVVEYASSNPKHNGKFRRIRLRLASDVEKREGNLQILASEGYYAPAR